MVRTSAISLALTGMVFLLSEHEGAARPVAVGRPVPIPSSSGRSASSGSSAGVPRQICRTLPLGTACTSAARLGFQLRALALVRLLSPGELRSSLRRAGLFAVGAGSTYLPAAGADRCRTSCRPGDQYHPLPARLRYPNRTVALEKRRRKIHTDRALLNIDAAALV
jgi:hypothetical protein